jgi:hypothetical protein
VDFDLAQRVGLASQPITLRQFAGRVFDLFFHMPGNFPSNHLAVVAIADAASNTADVCIELPGAFAQGLAARAAQWFQSRW